MDNLYVVMPAYNEEDNIEYVIDSWYPILKYGSKGSKLVVADSGSTDKTNDILRSLKKKYKDLVVISNTGKEHGTKLMYLYNYAIEMGADYIFQTDSDGQTNASEFEKFWEMRNDYDAILGNRVIRGDGYQRKFVEDVLCKILYYYFKVDIPDANAPFRLMRTSVVKKYIGKLPADYMLPNVMFSTYFSYYDERVNFLVIEFEARKGGRNSINMKEILKIGCKSLRDFSNFKKDL